MGRDEKRAPLKTPAWETSAKWTTCVSDGFDSDDSVQLGSEKTKKKSKTSFLKSLLLSGERKCRFLFSSSSF